MDKWELFADKTKLSLDHDLKDVLTNKQASVSEVILLQVLRIMRGRPFHIDLQPPQTSGWSDGKNWFPSEPGTFTTGNGPVPPQGDK